MECIVRKVSNHNNVSNLPCQEPNLAIAVLKFPTNDVDVEVLRAGYVSKCCSGERVAVHSKGFNPKEYVEKFNQQIANSALQALWKLR